MYVIQRKKLGVTQNLVSHHKCYNKFCASTCYINVLFLHLIKHANNVTNPRCDLYTSMQLDVHDSVGARDHSQLRVTIATRLSVHGEYI